MLDSTEVLESGGAAAGWREVARFPYAAQGLAGAHNFVEYQKAGREGKISTLPAQAVTESIMCTLTDPGCQRENKAGQEGIKDAL